MAGDSESCLVVPVGTSEEVNELSDAVARSLDLVGQMWGDAIQVLRRQTRLSRFCGREFMTRVSCAQYMQTMTTYCHMAI